MSMPNYACTVKYYSFYGGTVREALEKAASWPGLDRIEPGDVPDFSLVRADDGDYIFSILWNDVVAELPFEFEP